MVTFSSKVTGCSRITKKISRGKDAQAANYKEVIRNDNKP